MRDSPKVPRIVVQHADATIKGNAYLITIKEDTLALLILPLLEAAVEAFFEMACHIRFDSLQDCNTCSSCGSFLYTSTHCQNQR